MAQVVRGVVIAGEGWGPMYGEERVSGGVCVALCSLVGVVSK